MLAVLAAICLTLPRSSCCGAQESMGSSDKEVDEFKRMMLESNPYLLGVTMVSSFLLLRLVMVLHVVRSSQFVSILHMVFDFLAFKNDIAFWKNNKRCRRCILLVAFCTNRYSLAAWRACPCALL
jgi:hypothetical protein